MTFKTHVSKVYLVLVIALLAALLVPVLGIAAGQAIASHEDLDSGAAENVHLDSSPVTEIACSCGDPGGGNGCC
jgi:hypothetical protein